MNSHRDTRSERFNHAAIATSQHRVYHGYLHHTLGTKPDLLCTVHTRCKRHHICTALNTLKIQYGIGSSRAHPGWIQAAALQRQPSWYVTCTAERHQSSSMQYAKQPKRKDMSPALVRPQLYAGICKHTDNLAANRTRLPAVLCVPYVAFCSLSKPCGVEQPQGCKPNSFGACSTICTGRLEVWAWGQDQGERDISSLENGVACHCYTSNALDAATSPVAPPLQHAAATLFPQLILACTDTTQIKNVQNPTVPWLNGC